jgi:sortase B
MRWLAASLVVFAIGFALVFYATRELWTDLRDDDAAQEEYAQLREIIADIIAEQDEHTEPINTDPDSNPDSAPAVPPAAVSLDTFAVMNPDFVGWITIPGTAIHYPIVLGADNSRYLTTTFSGAVNPAGAIFMDYRCTGDWSAPVYMIHGHNMRNGSMFSQLHRYLEPGFIDNYPEVIILTADGERLVYRIFKVQRTDAWDRVFTLDFNNAESAAEFLPTADAGQLLILATCLDGADDDARLVVFSAL